MMLLEQKVDRLSIYGMVFVAGLITQAAIDHNALLPWLWGQRAQLVKVQTVDIPKIQSVAGCEEWRAKFAAALATKSENGADIDLRTIPNCPPIPSAKPKPKVATPHK